jgi:uncharacterized protein YaeQ
MTFVEAFYSFRIEISDSVRGIYEKTRVKIPRHPHESLDHMYSRLIAYCHAYRPGQQLGGGLFEPRDPAISNKDAIGNYSLWVDVGAPERKKLEKALRLGADVEFRIYFYDRSQIEEFSHHLKGSKSNWIENIRFYIIEKDLLQRLGELEARSADWEFTVVEDDIYVSVDGVELNTRIPAINMWQEFQTLIGNIAD